MNAVLIIDHYRIDYVLDLINDINQYYIIGIICPETIKRNIKKDERYVKNNIEVVTDLNDITTPFDVVITFVYELTSNDKYFSAQLLLAQMWGKDIVEIPFNNFQNSTFNVTETNIPIISVCKTDERINTYRIINSLKQKFEKDGLSTGVMTSYALGSLFGYQEISFEEIDKNSIDYCAQQINQQIKSYVDNNTFQVLIIDYPGCIGSKYMYAINSAIRPSYTIVLTEAYKLPKNYIKHQNSEIYANYLGTVDLILMSEYMFSFVDNNIKYGARLSKKSLKNLSKGVYPTVFDDNYIYKKIINKLENPEVLSW